MCPFCHSAQDHKEHCKKHLIIFLAGASTFHTFSHIMLAFTGTLPIMVFGYEITQTMNLWLIAINTAITIGLFWWLAKQPCSHEHHDGEEKRAQ